jgi:cyclopropane fatty-acyl-phospholipid synthase-like methyltransferase
MSYWDNVDPIEMGGTDDTTQEHVDKLLFLAPTGGSVLEIGCGMGRLLSELTGFFDNLYGYDPSETLLAKAPKGKIIYTTDLPDRKFDFIYSMLVFQHITDESKKEYIEYASKHLLVDGMFKFQYVTEGERSPQNFPVKDDDINKYCLEAGFTVNITQDSKYPQWSWATCELR